MKALKSLPVIFLLFKSAFSIAQVNDVNGNIGIGTTNPKSKLDVYGPYNIYGSKVLDNIQINPSIGFFNPIWYALRNGKKLFSDEEFQNGMNSLQMYDNNGSTQTSLTRINLADVPNASGLAIEVKHTGAGTTPGYGGFYQPYMSGMNKTIVQMFRAKVPAGYELKTAANPIGSNGFEYWLTNNMGTGKWEWYIRVTQSGNGGTFSTAGHIYVTGSPAPTAQTPVVWHIGSCTSFDVTNTNTYQSDYIVNQNSTVQNATINISGNALLGGKVGIGTTNPSEKLSVRGNISSGTSTGVDGVFANILKYGLYADLESGTANANRWHGIDATITAGAASSNKIKFRLYPGSSANAAPVDVMTLSGDGNVGIGTSSPLALLDVGQAKTNALTAVLGRLPEGNTTGTGTFLGVRALSSQPGPAHSFSLEHRFYGELNSAINFYRGGGTTGGFITFATNNGAEKMRILANGRVGVGTENPQSEFSVNGEITAKKVRVTATGWSDFVFDKNYELRSLSSLKNYIQQYKHLPNVPSEKEVLKNGVDVVAVQAALLQKIEELTLYIIQQDERLKDLERRIDKKKGK